MTPSGTDVAAAAAGPPLSPRAAVGKARATLCGRTEPDRPTAQLRRYACACILGVCPHRPWAPARRLRPGRPLPHRRVTIRNSGSRVNDYILSELGGAAVTPLSADAEENPREMGATPSRCRRGHSGAP